VWFAGCTAEGEFVPFWAKLHSYTPVFPQATPIGIRAPVPYSIENKSLALK
jgi:hypothetical protein